MAVDLLADNLKKLQTLEDAVHNQDTTTDREELVEDFMSATYELGRQTVQDPATKESAEFSDYKNQAAVILNDYTHRLQTYVQRTDSIFAVAFQHDEWIAVCKRRSAIEFLREFSEGTSFELSSLSLVDTGDLDDNIMAVGENEGHLDPSKIPPGIPGSHWWWWYPDTSPAE